MPAIPHGIHRIDYPTGTRIWYATCRAPGCTWTGPERPRPTAAHTDHTKHVKRDHESTK